jgi:hypothetical protein
MLFNLVAGKASFFFFFFSFFYVLTQKNTSSPGLTIDTSRDAFLRGVENDDTDNTGITATAPPSPRLTSGHVPWDASDDSDLEADLEHRAHLGPDRARDEPGTKPKARERQSVRATRRERELRANAARRHSGALTLQRAHDQLGHARSEAVAEAHRHRQHTAASGSAAAFAAGSGPANARPQSSAAAPRSTCGGRKNNNNQPHRFDFDWLFNVANTPGSLTSSWFPMSQTHPDR